MGRSMRRGQSKQWCLPGLRYVASFAGSTVTSRNNHLRITSRFPISQTLYKDSDIRAAYLHVWR